MKKILMIDEVLALARLSQVAFDKPIKYMDDTDAELIARLKKPSHQNLLSRCVSEYLSLKRSFRL
jgi:hypothetical protein